MTPTVSGRTHATKTENICRSVCKKMQDRSDSEHEIEAEQRVKAAFEGKPVPAHRIYEKELYEPYEVKSVYELKEMVGRR